MPPRAKKPVAKSSVVKMATRRSAYELIQALEAKRDSWQTKIDKINNRIAAYKANYADKLAIQELSATKTFDELALAEAELKERLKIIRKARKVVAGR